LIAWVARNAPALASIMVLRLDDAARILAKAGANMTRCATIRR
jgi:hypothetical protein